MSAHYYCEDTNTNSRHDFSNLHQAILFFKHHALPQGKIFVEEIKDFVIKYNIQDGKVAILVQTDPATSIKNYYSTKAFNNYTLPIKEAISALAKLHLLLEIAKLEDRVLMQLIHSSHYNQNKELVNLSPEYLDSTLYRIQYHKHEPILFVIFRKIFRAKKLNKVHQAVSEALSKHPISSIKCQNDADIILAAIKQNLQPVMQATK